MAHPVCEVLLTKAALNSFPPSGFIEAGAVIDFWGLVRETEAGERISGIEYEAHRAMAEHQLRVIAEEAREKFALMQVVIRHRIGFVPVSEASLLVRVACGHRAEAFLGGKWVVDELKKRAPIWKHPRFTHSVLEAQSFAEGAPSFTK